MVTFSAWTGRLVGWGTLMKNGGYDHLQIYRVNTPPATSSHFVNAHTLDILNFVSCLGLVFLKERFAYVYFYASPDFVEFLPNTSRLSIHILSYIFFYILLEHRR